jgi:uncharacterized protein (DUF2062 family)
MKRFIKQLYFKVMRYSMRMRLETGMIARSIGIGAAIGFTPTVGAQLLLCFAVYALFVLMRFTKFDLFIAGIATFVVNPITMVPTYTLYYFMGCVAIDCEGAVDFNQIESFQDLLAMGGTAVSAIVLGSIPFVTFGLIGGYWLGLTVERLLERRRECKRLMAASRLP